MTTLSAEEQAAICEVAEIIESGEWKKIEQAWGAPDEAEVVTRSLRSLSALRVAMAPGSDVLLPMTRFLMKGRRDG